MTTLEIRMLYLLVKHGGSAKHSELSQATSRHKSYLRLLALHNLEDLGLIKSARQPATKRGGQQPLVYWLTIEGRLTTPDMIDRGEMKDPAREVRGRKPNAST